MKRVLALVALGACWPSNVPPEAVPEKPQPIAPEPRVRKLLAAQISAVNDEKLHATFADGTVLSTTGGGKLASELPAETFAHAAIASLEVGGTDDIVWFDAELELQGKALRYTGAAVNAKVVAGSLVDEPMPIRGSGAPEGRAFPNPSPPSSLTKLVLDGPALTTALAPEAIVLGPEHERGHGPSAMEAWASRTLALDTNPREIVDDDWATFQANVVFPQGNLGLFVVAVPRSGGGWMPVFVQYIGK